MLTTIVAAIIVLGGLIFFHELGHFAVARWLGMGVSTFSLGFGPKILGFTRGKTRYLLSAIPLGGYVQLVAQDPDDQAPDDFPPETHFRLRPAWQRMIVVAAGPVFNFVLAWLLFWGLLLAEGRYEMLWLSLGVTGLAVLAADRFTVAGLGESFATNLGLNYKALVLQGLIVVSVVTACVVVTVGSIPFVGLIVPNLVRLMLGDNVRRSVWWVAIAGAALTMLCDLFGRLIIAPYEIPVGTVMGVVGSGLFLAILLRRRIKG